jgi:hypothetical protein
VRGRRHALPEASDYQALRAALAAAGLPQQFIDDLHYEDVEDCWRRGLRVPQIVEAAKRWERAQRGEGSTVGG